MTLSPPLVSEPTAFTRWATAMLACGELSKASVSKYETLWNAWLGWLALHEIRWDAVTPLVVCEFLAGSAPGQGGRRPALRADRMSSYTRQRYWRLLNGVYGTAVAQGFLATSPLSGVPESDRPRISSRDRRSQVLEPAVFERLCDPKALCALVPVTSDADWWHVRDRAILALLVETGITNSEVIALRGRDLKEVVWRPVSGSSQDPDGHTGFDFETEARSGHDEKHDFLSDIRLGSVIDWAEGSGSDHPSDPTSGSLAIEVMDPSERVGRTLWVSQAMKPLLMAWVRERQALLKERADRHGTPVGGQGKVEFLARLDLNGPLFVARRAREADSELPAMEAVTVYYGVSQVLKRLRASLRDPSGPHGPGVEGDEPYVAKGAAVIRNSVIKRWLDTVGLQEAVKRAGLKDVDSLRLRPTRTAVPPV